MKFFNFEKEHFSKKNILSSIEILIKIKLERALKLFPGHFFKSSSSRS